MKKLGMMLGLVTALLATPALADPHDGQPSVTVHGCDVTIHAKNLQDQTLGWIIRIGRFVGDGRVVEEGTLAPGASFTRTYHGEAFYRVRLGLPSDHFYSSAEGSTHCPSPTPSPSPSPSVTPTPSPSPSPTPSPSTSPSPTSTQSVSPSPTSTPSPSTVSSPSPPEGVLSESSSSPPGGTPNTGADLNAAWIFLPLGLLLIGAALLRYSRDDR